MTSADAPTTYRGAWRVYWQHASTRLIAAFVLLSAVLRWHAGALAWADLGLMLLALAQWPLLEWLLHRYALHAKPLRVAGRDIVFDFAAKHAQHHAQPWLPQLVFLPWYVPATLAPLLLWLALVLGAPALSFMVGLGLAALNYEWSHWIVHTRIRPKNAYYQRLFRNHRLHHFRHEGYWFSFMWPELDKHLGTGPEESMVAFSATARDINAHH